MLMAVERYVTVKIATWRKLYFDSKRAVIVSLVVFFVYLLCGVPLLLVEVNLKKANNTFLTAFDIFTMSDTFAIYIKVLYVTVLHIVY